MKHFLLLALALIAAPAFADSPEVGGDGTVVTPSVTCVSANQKTYYYIHGQYLHVVDWSQGRPRTIAWVPASGSPESGFSARDNWYSFSISGGVIRDGQGNVLGSCH